MESILLYICAQSEHFGAILFFLWRRLEMLAMLLGRTLIVPVGTQLGSLTEGLDPLTIPDWSIEANACEFEGTARRAASSLLQRHPSAAGQAGWIAA